MAGKKLSRQSGWRVRGRRSALVTDRVAYRGRQAVEIKPTHRAWPANRIVHRAPAGLKGAATYVDFWIKPVVATDQDQKMTIHVDGARLGFVEKGGEGVLVISNTDQHDGKTLQAVGGSFSIDATGAAHDWMRITLCHDFTHRVWDLSVNGQSVAQGLRLERSVRSAAVASIQGHRSSSIFVDEFLWSTENPLHVRIKKGSHADSDKLTQENRHSGNGEDVRGGEVPSLDHAVVGGYAPVTALVLGPQPTKHTAFVIPGINDPELEVYTPLH